MKDSHLGSLNGGPHFFNDLKFHFLTICNMKNLKYLVIWHNAYSDKVSKLLSHFYLTGEQSVGVMFLYFNGFLG